MKRVRLIVIALSLIIVSSSAIVCADYFHKEPETSENITTVSPKPEKYDFNIFFLDGYVGILNTFQGTFTKNLIMDPSITVYLSLSEEDRDRIYQKMIEIDFFSYPNPFFINVPPGEPRGQATPCPAYYFKVEYQSQIKELWWSDCITNPNEKADKLRELIKLIREIYQSKEEYKKLPEPRGGFI
jgi:hypothetical protein